MPKSNKDYNIFAGYGGSMHPMTEYASKGNDQELDASIKLMQNPKILVNFFFHSKLDLSLLRLACLGGSNVATLKILAKHGAEFPKTITFEIYDTEVSRTINKEFLYACNAGHLDIIKFIRSKGYITFVNDEDYSHPKNPIVNILSSLFRPTLIPELKASDDELADTLEYLLELFFGDNYEAKQEYLTKKMDNVRNFSAADCFFYFGYDKTLSKLSTIFKQYLPEDYEFNMVVGENKGEISFDNLDLFERGMLSYYAYIGDVAGVAKAIALGIPVHDTVCNILFASEFSVHFACKENSPVANLEALMRYQAQKNDNTNAYPDGYYLLHGDDHGSNILHLVANSGRLDLLKMLLLGIRDGDKIIKYPAAHMSLVDIKGNSALHALVMTTNINDAEIRAMVKLLHQHKLNFMLKNQDSQTALDLAISLKNMIAAKAICGILSIDLDKYQKQKITQAIVSKKPNKRTNFLGYIYRAIPVSKIFNSTHPKSLTNKTNAKILKKPDNRIKLE